MVLTVRGEPAVIIIMFWWGNLKERENLEDVGANGRTELKHVKELDVRQWTGLMWLRIGTRGGLL